MAEHNCAKCGIRAKYDSNPRSLIGRFWRWHINFCPGWKKYIVSLNQEEQAELRKKYNFYK